MDRTEQPVWEVYDALRTAAWNVEYFLEKLARAKRRNRNVEIAIAVSVPSSIVAGLPIWKDYYSARVWIVLTVVAAVAATAKPFLGLVDSIQAYENAVTMFRTVQAEISRVKDMIESSKDYSTKARSRLEFAKESLLRALEFEPREPADAKLGQRVFDRVNARMPAESFFVPRDE